MSFQPNKTSFHVRWHDENGTMSQIENGNMHTAILEGKRSKKFERYSFDVMRVDKEWNGEIWTTRDIDAIAFVGIDGKVERYYFNG